MLRFRSRVLRFRDLGASFSRFGCFVFEFWVLRASVFVFECFVFETTVFPAYRPNYNTLILVKLIKIDTNKRTCIASIDY